MDITMREEYQVRLTKREFTLITKALVGKLSADVVNIDHTTDPEIEEARKLGLELIDRARERTEEKQDALEHAYRKAAG